MKKTHLFWAFLRSFLGIWWFHLLCIPLGKNWGKDFLHLQNEQGSPTPLLGKNLFGCFQPYVAERSPAKEERDDFRLLGKTFGIALGKSPGKTRGKTFGE